MKIEEEKALAIIPARFASTRFPGKPLVKIDGISMIERVYTQVSKCPLVSNIIVATDHEAIRKAVLDFGGKVVMTSEDCVSGTDRCAEVLRKAEVKEDIILNIQGDEPFIHPEQISELVTLIKKDGVEIGTLAHRILDQQDLFNPNLVKLVSSAKGRALYFSRNPIPYVRGEEGEKWLEKTRFFKHIGLYGFRKKALLELAGLPMGELEMAESLEQLRWLEADFQIFVGESEWESLGIDTPEDLARAEQRLRSH